MEPFTREDLEAAGWSPAAPFERLLDEARRLFEQGNRDRAYILKRLERVAPKRVPQWFMRDAPLPFAEAIEAETKEEQKNLQLARRTMRELMACPVIEAGSLMPDACPAGSAPASIPVGGVVEANAAILPSAHGHDIACSMHATVFEVPESRGTPSDWLDVLAEVTRFGPGGRSPAERVGHAVLDEPVWDNPFLKGLRDYGAMYLADQGDGNHFAFLGQFEGSATWLQRLQEAGYTSEFASLQEGRRYQVLVTHHGSRGLGARVFRRAQEAAVVATKWVAKGIPEAACWLSVADPEGQAYWEALQYLGRWTLANHQLIHRRFLERLERSALVEFGNVHNFVWRRGDRFLHGKGATPAWRDGSGRPLLGLIPLNMASPVLMVLGGDRKDYLSFAPHGAGRNLSRRGLLRQFRQRDGSLDDLAMNEAIEESTRQLEVRWYHGKPDVAECPVAYKSPDKIRHQIETFGLAEIVAEIQPVGSIMAGRAPGREEVLSPKQRRQMEHRSQRRRDRQKIRGQDWAD